MNLSAEIVLAHRLADAARDMIRPHFRVPVAAERKGDATPVTIADREAEQAMRRILIAEVPQDGVHGEEFGITEGRSGRQWVLDPIDGTCAFLAGRAMFGTLIALVVDGFPVLGMIDQPILGERWLGAAGQLTTLNGKPIGTRACRQLSDAILASTGPQYFPDCTGEHFSLLARACRDTVWGGDCYNYALLASGHIDIVVEAGLKLHDIAALVPVVEGAGGRMCDWSGEPLTDMSDGRVIALGDPARLDDVLDALNAGHEGH